MVWSSSFVIWMFFFLGRVVVMWRGVRVYSCRGNVGGVRMWFVGEWYFIVWGWGLV